MDLFLTPKNDFVKTAAEVKLPEDPNQWPGEILQELYKQVPYVSDFDPSIVMDRVDGERGFGLGHVSVRGKTEAPHGASPESLQAAGVQEARIPIIVKEGSLCSLDVLILPNSKVVPLTENRLRQAIFRPQAFDVTSKTPGDHSMVGQLYPPQRTNFGYGGAGVMGAEGMGKTGSAADKKVLNAIAKQYPELASETKDKRKVASLLSAILPTINESDYEKFASRFADDDLRVAYASNRHNTSPALNKLASFQGWSVTKVAHRVMDAVRPTVMQITREEDDGYALKTASHQLWQPKVVKLDRGQLVKRAGAKIALEADLKGTVTIAEGACVDRDLMEDQPEQVKDFGIWRVRTVEGEELVGYVFPVLLDLDGHPLPMALFSNGSAAALQADIAGIRVSEGASLFEGSPKGLGVFYMQKGGKAIATIPMTLNADLSMPGRGGSTMAETFDGRQVNVVRQPQVKIPLLSDDTLVVPTDWQWLSLQDAKSVQLVGEAGEVAKEAQLSRGDVVYVHAGGTNSFGITGPAVEKLGSQNWLDFNDTVFLLAGLGVAPAFAQQKMASALYWSEPVACRVGREIQTLDEVVNDAAEKTASALKGVPCLRVDLVKEAAFIPDPTSVDTVLSLGFINPENVGLFVEHLPSIDETQGRMCELLIAARLGLPTLSVAALERAIKATEDVCEGLRVLAFNNH